MFDILVQCGSFGKLIHISVNPYTDITAFLCSVQKLDMGSFSPPHNRCHQLDLCSFRKCHDLIGHLICRLLLDLSSTLRTMRNPDSCIQQSKIIVNLRHGSDCGSRIAVRRLLVNGNRR